MIGVGRCFKLPGEPVDHGGAREGTEEPVGRSRRVRDDENLVTIEHLGCLGIDHRADDERADGSVCVVLQLVRSSSANGTRDDLSWFEDTRASERPQSRPSRKHDDQFLVRVVQVKRRPVLARINFVERRSQPLGASEGAYACGASTERCVRSLHPLGLVDVRHGGDASRIPDGRQASCD